MEAGPDLPLPADHGAAIIAGPAPYWRSMAIGRWRASAARRTGLLNYLSNITQEGAESGSMGAAGRRGARVVERPRGDGGLCSCRAAVRATYRHLPAAGRRSSGYWKIIFLDNGPQSVVLTFGLDQATPCNFTTIR